MKNSRRLAFYFFIPIFISIFLSIPALSLETGIAVHDLSIKTGDTARVPITIQGAQNMSTVTFILTYNPEIISVESVSKGDFGEPVNNTDVGMVIIAIIGPSDRDKGILATLSIKGINAGITQLEFAEPNFYKDDGSILNISTAGGIITVEGQAGASITEVKPVTSNAAIPEVKNTSVTTPLKQDKQQEKAVKTPALSWIFVVGIIVVVAIIRRRNI